MAKKATEGSRLNWRLPVWAAGIELFIFIPVAMYHPDTVFWFCLLFVLPTLLIISLVLIVKLIRAVIGHGHANLLPVLVTLVILWAAPTSLELYERGHPFALYESGKWLTGSGQYKSEVLAQPTSASGELKHVEWDESGFLAGVSTTVYLVFDPSDGLYVATKRLRPGRVNGVPCEVYSVQRLEPRWYSVVFYTNEYWGHCD